MPQSVWNNLSSTFSQESRPRSCKLPEAQALHCSQAGCGHRPGMQGSPELLLQHQGPWCQAAGMRCSEPQAPRERQGQPMACCTLCQGKREDATALRSSRTSQAHRESGQSLKARGCFTCPCLGKKDFQSSAEMRFPVPLSNSCAVAKQARPQSHTHTRE